MTTTVTIGVTPINATYTAVTGTTGGAGTGAKFDVTKTNGVYTTVVEAANAGTGYALGDTVTIPGTALGGAAPANNDVIIVTALGTNGAIKAFATAGVGAIGNGIVNTVIEITGTTGVDNYVLGDKSSNFSVTNNLSATYASNYLTVASTLAPTTSFKLDNFERVTYTDKATAFDITGTAGDVYALLKAGFGGTVNTTYEGIGIKLEDAGTTSAGIAQAIATSTVFQTANPDFATFVNNVYTNVMGVAPTPTQASPYITALATNATTEAALLNAAAHLVPFQQTIGLVGVAPATTGVLAASGIDYIPA
jgi:hypothetical protein